jgi:FtsZ-binding cell division protein ZapB
MSEENVIVDPAPVAADPQQTPVPAPVAQAPVPANNGWEAEKKAFIADLQKERKARQALETQSNTYKTQYETEQRRVRALSGVDPLDPAAAEAAEVRNRFKQVVSREQLLEMAGLTEDDIASIKANRESSTALQQTTEHYWQSHGRTMLGSLEKEVAQEFGGEKLTPSQSKVLRAAYVQAAQDDPEFLQRHEQGDTTLITEFAKTFAEDWIKPAQRRAQAVEIGRRQPLPSGKDRTVTAPGGKKIDVNDPKAVEDLLVAGFRERGGNFGR